MYYVESFKFAQHYESLFFKKFSNISNKEIKWINQKDDADYLVGRNKLELKIDQHTTDNYFIELVKNTRKQIVGGPHQATSYNTKYFAFWFINLEQNNLFVFQNNELVKWIDENKNTYRNHYVKNREYWSSGIIVPRADLVELCKVRTMIVEEKERYR